MMVVGPRTIVVTGALVGTGCEVMVASSMPSVPGTPSPTLTAAWPADCNYSEEENCELRRELTAVM